MGIGAMIAAREGDASENRAVEASGMEVRGVRGKRGEGGERGKREGCEG